MIQSLCVELLQEIGKELPGTAQKDLRAACRYTDDAVAPLFFSSVFLNTDHLRRKTSIWGLEHLATGESGWSMHAKTLEIAPCSPVGSEDEDPISNGALEALFTSALGSLMKVRDVRWVMTDDDPSWQRDAIAKYLRSLPHLTSLELHLEGTRDFSVPRLSQLHSLKITLAHCHLALHLTESDSRAIARNRGLTALTLLGLHDCGTAHAQLWATLHAKGVRLREISTTSVSADLLDYLRGYAGVEKLSLEGMGGGHSRDESSAYADLTCPLGYENNWTFGTHSVAAIAKLRRLARLSVGVMAHDTVLREEGETNALDLLFETATTLPALRALSVSACYTSAHRPAVEAAIATAFQARRSAHPPRYKLDSVKHHAPHQHEHAPGPAPVVAPVPGAGWPVVVRNTNEWRECARFLVYLFIIQLCSRLYSTKNEA
ncbi:hypothetical protein C8R46DRAFT_1356201 [Mycena filopes]|nr:hypothetical protein C8R46DRAFT_1356201 [Mycena filopes]